MANMISNSNSIKNIKIWTSAAPFSLDPTEYDYFGHHTAFRSVYWTLLTSYSNKQYIPIIAQNWESANDGRIWRFKIRENLTFSNGMPLKSDDVYKSLLRSLYVLRNKKSHSPLIDNLIGYESFSNLKIGFPGLILDKEYISFHYTKPNYNILDALSFGFFGVMPASCWDDRGAWSGQPNCPTSGAYKVVNWQKDHLTLELRPNLPAGTHALNAPYSVQMEWPPAKPNDLYDVIVGSSNLKIQGKKFSGPTESGIFFVRVVPYNLENHALNDPKIRRWIKREFYLALSEVLPKYKKNFLPDILTSNSDFHPMEEVNVTSPNIKIRYRLNKNLDPVASAANQAIEILCKKNKIQCVAVDLAPEVFMNIFDKDHKNYDVDLAVVFTTILIEAPLNDLRFMLLSKEGIRLPDLNGLLKQELSKQQPNLDEFNKILWSEDIIWPIGHFSLGLWSSPSITFEEYNRNQPPLDISWLNL